MSAGKSRLRRTISAWADVKSQEARDLRRETARSGCVCIADSGDRERVLLRGTLSSVMLRPRGGVPALEAELDDGSGRLSLIWLGRRRIAGIAPGRRIQVEGRIGVQDGERVLWNPRYDLIP
jgi:hypothetical protein